MDGNGKLVRTMGRHGFPGVISHESLACSCLYAMAAEEKVVSTLNRLADRAFLDVLSPRDNPPWPV